MTSIKPIISVVIPHLNQLQELEHCLTSLERQTLDRAQFEVIVVDNGSSIPPDPVVMRHPGTRLLSEQVPGPGPARNTGSRNAGGDILAFIDADCRADPAWLATALRSIRSLPEGTILGGDVMIWRDHRPLTAIAAYESVFAYRFKLYIERYGFSGTGNLAVKRSDFMKIGPFAGISLAEDVEWGQRALQGSFHFSFVPGMIVFHPARNSMHELRVKWDRHILHALNQSRGKPGWRLRWIARAFAVLMSPAIDFAKVLTSNRIEGWAPRIKAMAVLIEIRFHRCRKMIGLLWHSEPVIWNRSAGI